ncbi:MAG: S-layer homology domain-containing protein [Oscillospiraceae bacterium]|nr:S-layer homology domain-containing protein [Oscillospiraceae bacterium]
MRKFIKRSLTFVLALVLAIPTHSPLVALAAPFESQLDVLAAENESAKDSAENPRESFVEQEQEPVQEGVKNPGGNPLDHRGAANLSKFEGVKNPGGDQLEHKGAANLSKFAEGQKKEQTSKPGDHADASAPGDHADTSAPPDPSDHANSTDKLLSDAEKKAGEKVMEDVGEGMSYEAGEEASNNAGKGVDTVAGESAGEGVADGAGVATEENAGKGVGDDAGESSGDNAKDNACKGASEGVGAEDGKSADEDSSDNAGGDAGENVVNGAGGVIGVIIEEGADKDASDNTGGEADEDEAEEKSTNLISMAVNSIDDGVIQVEIDEDMQITVYRLDGSSGKTPLTKPIENMSGAGATAPGVVGAWSNTLPWSRATGTDTAAATANFINGSAMIHSAKSGYLTRGYANRMIQGSDLGEELLTDEFTVQRANTETDVDTYFGRGNRLTVVGVNSVEGLERTLVFETGAVKGAIAMSTYYKYYGVDENGLDVFKFVENNFKIEDVKPALVQDPDTNDVKIKAGLWSYQGAPVTWSADYILPVWDNMGVGNFIRFNYGLLPGTGNGTHASYNTPATSGSARLSQNNWFTGEDAGVPYNTFYGKNVGIGIGSIMPYHVYGLEMPVRGSGLKDNHEVAYTWIGWPGRVLAKDVETYIGTSVLTAYSGDYFDGNNLYGRVMDNVDMKRFIDKNETGIADTFVKVLDEDGDPVDNLYYIDGVPKDLLVLPKADELPRWAFDPIWETIAYVYDFKPVDIIENIEFLKELGIGSITYDDGWYERNDVRGEGVYLPLRNLWAPAAEVLEKYFTENPHPKAATDPAYDFSSLPYFTYSANNVNLVDKQGVRVVRAMNEFLHLHGIKVTAWAMQPLARANMQNNGLIPEDWYCRKPDGSKATEESASNARLCPANPDVMNKYTDYLSNLIFGDGIYEYAFDGFKGDSFYGMGPCYGLDGEGGGHGHDGDIYASMRNYGLFFKLLYDKANLIRGATKTLGGPIVDVERVAVMKNCMCGKTMDYYVWSGTNRPIWGDHSGSRSNRAGNKSYRGFYGPGFPMDSDHHDLDFSGRNMGENNFISALGTGMIFNSKFRFDGKTSLGAYEPYAGQLMIYPDDPDYANKTLTGVRGTYGSYVKYYGLYQDLRIVEADMVSGLYKYGLDYPEAYVFERNKAATGGATGGGALDKLGDRYYSFYPTTYAIEADDAFSGMQGNYYKNRSSQVSLYDPWGGNGIWLSKNTYEGPIELRGLAAGSYSVTNIETGMKYEQSTTDGEITLDDEFIRNGAIYHVTPEANRTGSVFGYIGVVRGSGVSDLAGALVSLLDSGGNQVGWQTSTDLDGFYCFPLVPIGSGYTITVTHPLVNGGDEYVLSSVSAEPTGTSKSFNIVDIHEEITLSESGTYSFTSSLPGYTSVTPRLVTVSNAGTLATGALTIALSGANKDDFILSKTSLPGIPISGNDSFTVTPRAGLALGNYEATVTVADAGAGGAAGVGAKSFIVRFYVGVVTTTTTTSTTTTTATTATTGTTTTSDTTTTGGTVTTDASTTYTGETTLSGLTTTTGTTTTTRTTTSRSTTTTRRTTTTSRTTTTYSYQYGAATASPTPTPTATPTPTPTTTPAPTTQPVAYTYSLMLDIEPDYWAAEFIDGLVALGIVDGYPMGDGTVEFRPENPITRAEMAKLLVVTKKLDLIDDYDGSRFADWDSVADWAKPYIAAAIEGGVMVGSNEGDGIYILAEDFIIREQMIAMAVRSLGIEIPIDAGSYVTDFDAVSDWAKDYVAFAVEKEMINIDEALNVKPIDEAARAEAAMILYKLIQYLEEGGATLGVQGSGVTQSGENGAGTGAGTQTDEGEDGAQYDEYGNRIDDYSDNSEEQYRHGVSEYVDEDGVTRYLDEKGAIIGA